MGTAEVKTKLINYLSSRNYETLQYWLDKIHDQVLHKLLLSLDQQCCPNLIAYYFYKADDLLWWPLKVAAKRQRKINPPIINLHLKKTIFILAVYTFNSKLASPHFLYCVPFFPPPPWINPNLLNDFDTHVFFCKLHRRFL